MSEANRGAWGVGPPQGDGMSEANRGAWGVGLPQRDGMSLEPAALQDAVDPDRLRRALGAFGTGVTVITTGGPTPHGMTANSFTSVSLDPPLALVCVRRDAVMHRCMRTGQFGVSVLAADQERIARHFADTSRPLGVAQFAGLACTPGPGTGVPLIDGALARFECRVCDTYPGGDHSIFLAKVLTLGATAGEDDALLFYRGRFRRLEPRSSELPL